MEKLKKYILFSFILSTIVFLGGIYIGYNMQGREVNSTNVDISNIKNQIGELEIMMLMNSVNKNLTCTYLENNVAPVQNELENVREKVASMENDVKLRNSNEYNELAENLIKLRIRYWMLGEEIRKNCDKNLTTILYFYTMNQKCQDCEIMGYELTDISSKCKVVIAPIPIDSNIELVKTFSEYYNLSAKDVPTLIINQNQTIKGLVSEKELEKIICHR